MNKIGFINNVKKIFKLKKFYKKFKQHKLWLNTDGWHGKRLEIIAENLYNFNFSNINLKYALFWCCNLENVDFSGSDLTGAIFNDCYSLETIITDENTLPKIHCPEIGEFIGYKSCWIHEKSSYCIVKLLIPDNAKRSSATRNKCRCSKAKVLGFYDLDGNEIELNENEKIVSYFDDNFEYKLGELVYPDSFDEFRWKECTHGIHFYMTFDEAVKN